MSFGDEGTHFIRGTAPSARQGDRWTDTSNDHQTKVYDGSRWVDPMVRNRWAVLPHGWDDVWVAARNASGSTPCWITVIGDSVGQGSISTDFMATSWYALLRGSLINRYGLYGDFYSLAESARFLTYAGGTYNGTPPWVIGVAPAAWNAHGYGRVPTWTSAPSNFATFVSPAACTAMDIIYGHPYVSSGTFTYTVDGGTGVVVSMGNTDQYQHRAQITSLANTTHTIILTAQSADNAAHVWGVATYPSGGTGVGFGKLSAGGVKLIDWTTSSTQPNNRMTLMQGLTSSASTGFGFPTQPHLAIIELGLNDCQSLALGPDGFEHGLRLMIQGLRRGRANCSIVLLVPSNPDGQSSDVTSGLLSNPENWPLYAAKMASVARAWNCALVNIHGKWGENGVALGFQGATNPHPIDAGHADIAALLGGIL